VYSLQLLMWGSSCNGRRFFISIFVCFAENKNLRAMSRIWLQLLFFSLPPSPKSRCCSSAIIIFRILSLLMKLLIILWKNWFSMLDSSSVYLTLDQKSYLHCWWYIVLCFSARLAFCVLHFLPSSMTMFWALTWSTICNFDHNYNFFNIIILLGVCND
jgi:hypothetical protein